MQSVEMLITRVLFHTLKVLKRISRMIKVQLKPMLPSHMKGGDKLVWCWVILSLEEQSMEVWELGSKFVLSYDQPNQLQMLLYVMMEVWYHCFSVI